LPSYTSISIPVPCIFYCFALWPTNAQLFHKLSHCYMFRHYHVILRQPVINTLPSYTSISIPVPWIFCYFALWPTNAQLFHKLSHCYMFRHYHVILRQPVINTLPSYTSISIPVPCHRGTAVGQWLRCCATDRKVAGSIPASVFGIFHWHKILRIAVWPWSGLSL